MNYKMTSPCVQCPFLKTSGFEVRSLKRHAKGEFACHMQCDLNQEGTYEERAGNVTPHCAGALIFLEKRDAPHQMMRICERIGMYDRTKLDMKANVQ